MKRCAYCKDLIVPVGDVGDVLTIYEAEDGTTDCMNHLDKDGEPLAHQPLKG